MTTEQTILEEVRSLRASFDPNRSDHQEKNMSILESEVLCESINPPAGWEECEARRFRGDSGIKLLIDWERGIDMKLGEMLARRIAIYIRPESGAGPAKK